MTTKNRIIAGLMSNSTSKVKEIYLDSDAVNTSATLSAAIGTGTTTYSSIDSLPVSSNNGDQALVTSTNRLYIFSNGGWYNIALINTTPYWITEANSSYKLNTDGTSTTITILAVDSEGLPITYIATADSDFNQIATITKDSDDGRVFVVTPTDSDNGTAIAGSGTVTFKASDGINLATTLSTFSILFKIENSNYTSFLLKADTAGTDNQVDASTNAYSITEAGNVTSTAFTPYHPGGYSTYFDGNGDNIEVAEHTSTRVGNSDFTIEAWIYNNEANSTGLQTIFAQGASGIYSPFNLYFSNGGSGQPAAGKFVIPISSTGSSWDITDGVSTGLSSGTYDTHTWHHVALVREGSSFKLYVNGTLDSTIATSSATLMTPTEPSSVGARRTLGESFGGWIKDVRLVIGTAVYTGNFTSPTESLTAITNTKLLLCSLPYLAEASGNVNGTISEINGTPKTERFAPYDYKEYTEADYGGSVYFDGSGDWLTIGNSSEQMVPEAGDFTVEFWFYTANASTRMDPYSSYTSTTGFGIILNYSSGGTVTTYNGNTLTNQSAGGKFKANVWNHLAISRSGTTTKIFINGAVIHTNSSDSTDYSGTNTLYIGVAGNETQPYTGHISNVRFVKGTAVYTAAFTPPTEPLTAITNTELLTCTNKNDIWEQADGGPVMTKVGNVTASNAQRNFLTSSAMYFDGNGDYIDFVKKDGYSFESGVDFTVEGWWYMNSIAGRPHFIGMGTGIDGTPAHYSDWNMYYNSSNQLTFYYYDGSTAIARTFAWTPVISTWYHIAVSRSGTDLKAFVNGTQIGSTITDSTNFSGAAGSRPLRIGRWQYGGGINAYLNGYAQDIRITKGRAVYDSDFTPPTAEFNG